MKSYQVDTPETTKIKHYAMETLHAELVGVANIERFAGAPEKMSPQGIMPDAKSVIVMAVHHPDPVIELGGRKHPQEIGPYSLQYHMNWRLDDMSYRMSNFLEKEGFRAVPIVSSNIWRYCGYKNLTEQFAPDLSHMHAAVAAGLAEFGYNGLAITPEFGARQRYVTIVTDAVLTPSPLLEPGSVCDSCMICKKECRSGALSKEINGWNIVKIEDKEYRYAKKNLWRCAWGEHFDLDLDLPIPEHVDEKVIMEATIKHGRRGGEMGSCLRYCVPKKLRYFDKNYTNAPRRKKHFLPNGEIDTFHRGLFEEMRALADGWGADNVVISDAEFVRKTVGTDIAGLMPGAVRAVSLVSYRRKSDELYREENIHCNIANFVWTPVMVQSGYDMVRLLEKYGYTACQLLGFPEDEFQKKLEVPDQGFEARTLTFLTDAPLPTTGAVLPSPLRAATGRTALTRQLKREMERNECDLFGVAPAERINAAVPELAKLYDGEIELVARNKANLYQPYDPEITTAARKVAGTDLYLKGAKSVIMLGLRMPTATVDITARTPAEAAGPYVFAQYETIIRLRILAWRLTGMLEHAGFRAITTTDLHKTGSVCWNPRGEYPDAFSNVFAAAAAGLGRISRCGSLINPEFGSNARYIAVVTDAELDFDAVLPAEELQCARCDGGCFSACKTAAFEKPLNSVMIGGVEQKFRRIDVNRCNWAKRYSLIASEGNVYTGWHLDEKCPEKVTGEALAEAIRKVPQIEKIRPCNFEQCLLACPYSREQK